MSAGGAAAGGKEGRKKQGVQGGERAGEERAEERGEEAGGAEAADDDEPAEVPGVHGGAGAADVPLGAEPGEEFLGVPVADAGRARQDDVHRRADQEGAGRGRLEAHAAVQGEPGVRLHDLHAGELREQR